jgi:hypothetical protein
MCQVVIQFGIAASCSPPLGHAVSTSSGPTSPNDAAADVTKPWGPLARAQPGKTYLAAMGRPGEHAGRNAPTQLRGSIPRARQHQRAQAPRRSRHRRWRHQERRSRCSAPYCSRSLDESSPIAKAEVFMRFGEVHEKLEEKSKAIQMYERAVQADDTLEQAKIRLVALKSRAGMPTPGALRAILHHPLMWARSGEKRLQLREPTSRSRSSLASRHNARSAALVSIELRFHVCGQVLVAVFCAAAFRRCC